MTTFISNEAQKKHGMDKQTMWVIMEMFRSYKKEKRDGICLFKHDQYADEQSIV